MHILHIILLILVIYCHRHSINRQRCDAYLIFITIMKYYLNDLIPYRR